MSKDYYELLGVSNNASEKEIKSAYKRQARKFHPDVNKDAGAEEKFKEIQQAYDVLGDSKKRAKYDQFGSAAFEGNAAGAGGFSGFDFDEFSNFGGFSDIFDSFFGGQAAGRKSSAGRGSAKRQGEDLRYDFRIPLEMAYKGGEKTIEVSQLAQCSKCNGSASKGGKPPRTCSVCGGTGQVHQAQRTILGSFSQVRPCPNCHGEGSVISDPCSNCKGTGRERKISKVKVKIPAGVSTGTRLKITKAGNAGIRGGMEGDLYIYIDVERHKLFERDEDDIYYEANINFVQAALGDEISVPSLDGNISVKVPPGSAPGTVLRLRGKGIPHLHGSGNGSYFLKLNVDVPTNIKEKQKEALLVFAKEMKYKVPKGL